MTYPTTSGVVGTIAWEGFREGVEDVRYVTLQLDLLARAETQPATRQMAKETRTWLDEIDRDRDLDEVRAELTEKILILMKFEGQEG